MIIELQSKLQCPTCCRPDATLRLESFDADQPCEDVCNGAFICSACGAWYPIDDGILELVLPNLRQEEAFKSFCARFQDQLQRLGLSAVPSLAQERVESVEAQLKQRQHFDALAESGDLNYTDYSQQPFWRAVDTILFREWEVQIRPGSSLLDIGCANGRSSLHWARRGVQVTGFDISPMLVRQAIARARAEGLQRLATFFVADGKRPPFKPESFDYALTYGVLHHLPSPGEVCCAIQRILVKHGIHFALENNRSVFRGVFDLFMKVLPLWHEEAGEQPLMSAANMQAWVRDLSTCTELETRVFLPPHLCNFLGFRLCRILLAATDRLTRIIPLVRDQGGLIVAKIQRA
jgi:SAM-dependent methyltransferase/uncharacterized protein YbaR (Trm112 family)